MNTDMKNILIIGLGALGTVFATLLKESGHQVYGLTKERYLPQLVDRPFLVTGIWGEHRATPDRIASAIASIKDIPFDVIIVTVKSFDTAQAVEEIKPLVNDRTLVISAQNGYGNYETVARAVGVEHALLARIIFGVKVVEQGRAEVTVIADDVRIGSPAGAVPEERIREIADLFAKTGIPTQYALNVEAILWDKILYNAALNPLGALLECTYGQLAENPAARAVMDAVIDEIFLVARAHNKPLNWKSARDYKDHFYTRLVPPTAKHYPSMYYDMKAGKRLEIDALNGAIVALGRERGMNVPVNEVITRMVQAKESLSRK